MGLRHPDFTKALSVVRAMIRKHDNAVQRMATLGYPRTTTRRSKKSSAPAPDVLPDSGHSGGASGAGT